MSDSVETPEPPVTDLNGAPFIYFDLVPTFGTMAGAIQIELAARVIHPGADGQTTVSYVGTAHLRCSPAAAQQLMESLQKSLEMLRDLAGGGAPTGVAVN